MKGHRSGLEASCRENQALHPRRVQTHRASRANKAGPKPVDQDRAVGKDRAVDQDKAVGNPADKVEEPQAVPEQPQAGRQAASPVADPAAKACLPLAPATH